LLQRRQVRQYQISAEAISSSNIPKLAKWTIRWGRNRFVAISTGHSASQLLQFQHRLLSDLAACSMRWRIVGFKK
jgi:hypothetical protein